MLRLYPPMEARLDFYSLRRIQMRALRNGHWNRLAWIQRAFYKACLWYIHARGLITSSHVARLLQEVVEKLQTNSHSRVLEIGRWKSRELSSICSRRGVFSWCPSLQAWLREGSYLIYIGLLQKNNVFTPVPTNSQICAHLVFSQ